MKNKNATNRFTINFIKHEITGSKASFDKAGTGSGPIYEELMEKIARHPDFKCKIIKSKKIQNKRVYKGLNEKFMREYLVIQENSAELEAELNKCMEIAESSGRPAYPAMKKWFLNKFSKMDEPFDMNKAHDEICAASAKGMKNSGSSSKANTDKIAKIGA